ncbi:Dyp-type peroxidase [Paractinoplanes brasiliensis]|uniref:Dyp-type peroxidase family n=1 Tax=Paractinoplanes brasiliensis TaxID=52695 RepID=A0A4R6JM80_9ACTN|nr:Dyp-type peroxidase domain-containing protein [Actinoplanes brasiliensis]TDO37420.1 Dyp-type peroxidase family [Actinoplanes brasiliensis]GID29264.1 peroxidase [Actinoplanes brasiliensis]
MAIPAASPLADVQQIQGNILRPFGGTHQAFVALSFRNDRPGARRWLTGAAGRVAGTLDVPPRGEHRLPEGRSLLNVGLTAPGLVLLHPETASHLTGYDAFWNGPLGLRRDDNGRLTTTPALLGDVGPSDPRKWVVGGTGPSVDALLTIAAGDAETIEQALRRELAAAAAAGLEALHVERCQVRREDGKRFERFGFADGISQPVVRGFEDDENRPGAPVIAAGEFVLGCDGERRPPAWKARPVAARWMHGGSFQVFRRLNQDAQGWWEHVEELREPGEPAEDAAARLMGRRLDGTPLAKPGGGNDFSYADDPEGERTPRYAHIRKVNPREDVVFRDRARKMLRRGVPFGPPFDRENPDRADRGIVFNSYLTAIEDQFEFIQRRWANNPGFPASSLAEYGRAAAEPPGVDGLDPVLGDSPGAAAQRLPAAVVDKIPKAAYGGFVTTTGAVYAFAPSLPALRRLAGEESLV